MNAASIVLLGIAALAVLLTSVGVLLSRNVYERLHFLAPAATIGVVCVAAAIVLREGFHQAGFKAMVTAAILFVVNPILTHATARACRIRDHEHWEEDDR